VFRTTAMQHGNIRLPERLERWLQPVLVTTDMHRIHHSVEYDQTNSNSGAVLSIWDRLFDAYTWITLAQHDRIVFGVHQLPRRGRAEALRDAADPVRIGRAAAAEMA
jgi:sterol desaturase/sphingolipid hydroxylase (fatty acid hydroxylase superfamily)